LSCQKGELLPADVEVATWEGVVLPVWRFGTFEEFDHFMDTLLSVENPDTADAWFQALPMTDASGVMFGRGCIVEPGRPASPITRQAAVAICVIREDLPPKEYR
jgi:hypothetical protein